MKALVICGATATGKTALAVACAQKLNTEIVSADSMLIYRGLDIGTAKPSKAEQGGVKHHMIDVASAKEKFSVSDYEKAALPIVERLLDEGKTPIICGGTGFYINSLLYKSGFGHAGADEKVRAYYEEILKEKGNAYLHGLLKQKDPESASILHENDVKRVIRALEIYDVTGKKKSEQKDELIPRFDFQSVCVDYPRDVLYDRINRRVDIMFENGLEEEVDRLLQSGVDGSDQCMQGIGYKEIVNGRAEGRSLAEIKEEIKKNTRNYAKRQITFFKRMQNNVFLPPEQATVDEILQML